MRWTPSSPLIGVARIDLRTLGGLRIERDGEELRDLLAQPVRCALLLYLALERSATRDELAALLWPERDADRARHSLSQTLYELRRSLGEDWVDGRGDHLRVSVVVAVDALDFIAAAEAGHDDQALALYAGAFLEGCHFGDSPGFEAWVERRRAEIARLQRDVCRRLTASRRAAADPGSALSVARRWAELDPLEDEAHHQIIELLAESGRRAAALQHYERYRELIARELELEPLDETKALVAAVREGALPAQPSPLGIADDGGHAPERETEPRGALAPSAAPAAAGIVERHAAPRSGAWSLRRAHLWLLTPLGLVLIAAVHLLRVGGNPLEPTIAADAAASLDPRGVAVLPFLNMSAEPEKEYFADGITEDLLTSLSRIRDLRVISRTSVMRYKATLLPTSEIARGLGVRYLLEGSVRREGNQVRITAQLIDAADDSHLWAETYDRELSGIFAIKTEIAERIAEALARHLLAAERERITAGSTANLAAYDLLLRGRDYLNRPSDADLRKFPLALSFFRRAVEIEPGYARGYAGLSEAFRRHVALPLVPVRRDSMLVYSRRAVELDPELAEAATELGFAYLFAGDHARAEQELLRALALAPSQADAMEGMARLSALNARLDEAVRWQRRAVAVDPLSAEHQYRMGRYLFDLGDLGSARDAFERAVALAPDHPESSYLLAQIHLLQDEEELAEARIQSLTTVAAAHPGAQVILGLYHLRRGRYAAADAQLEQGPMAHAPGVLALRGIVAKKLGDEERAAALFRQPDELLASWEAAGLSIPPRGRLHRHVFHGDREGTLATLRQYWRSGLRWIEGGPEIGVYWIDEDPLLAELRGDPRFEALLREMRAELDSMRIRLDD